MTRTSALASIAALGLMAFAHAETVAADPVDIVDASAAPAGSVHVEINKMKYATPNIEIAAGTTIVWTNRDPVPHNVQLSSPIKVVGNMLRAGQSMALQFNEPGEYPYIVRRQGFRDS